MSAKKTDDMRQWVARWKNAAPELERIRKEELARVNTGRAIELLEDAFQSALISFPPLEASGLVEQQRWYMRLKH